MKKALLVWGLILGLTLCFGFAQAADNNCFTAAGTLAADAQSIRQTALGMGWTVGKTSSTTAASVIKGKVKLYPKGKVQTCLQVNSAGNGLEIKVQSDASDAGQAKWHKLPAKKKAK